MNDKELVEYVKEFRDGILDGRSSTGMCRAVCWPLDTLLNMMGVVCHGLEYDTDEMEHCYLVLADGRVLDPTADQFDGYPPVYLGEPREIHASAETRAKWTAAFDAGAL